MAKITIVTEQGILIEQIDTSGWNLDKSMARSELLDQILDAIKRADAETKKEIGRREQRRR